MCLAVESFWDVIGAEPAQVFADILAFYLCYIDWLPFFQTSIEKILIRLDRIIEDAPVNLILVSTTVRKVKQKP